LYRIIFLATILEKKLFIFWHLISCVQFKFERNRFINGSVLANQTFEKTFLFLYHLFFYVKYRICFPKINIDQHLKRKETEYISVLGDAPRRKLLCHHFLGSKAVHVYAPNHIVCILFKFEPYWLINRSVISN